MYKSLKEYVDLLEREDQLVRIDVQVDTNLEIAEITDRISKSKDGGKALLFENTGGAFPVLTNMMGSDKRIAMALGVNSLDEISTRIRKLFAELTTPKPLFIDKLKMLPRLNEMSRWLPRIKGSFGDCQQVAHLGTQAELEILPILKCWPHDAGPFITLPLVNTIDPDTGARNVGMYRMQVMSQDSTGMHWHIHKTGARHFEAYKRRDEIMPVSICLGGDPAYTYAATAPMPDNMDEYMLAGFLRKRPVILVKCLTNDIYVPSDCDFVIEGYVDPTQEKVVEGPFGDHTGFYSLKDLYPMFHVTAITHRKDAIYPATLVGIPPQEDVYIAKATEKIFLEPIRFAMQPELDDLYMPEAGVAHNLAIIKMKTSYPGQPFKVASSMWGAGQMMFNKFLLVCSSTDDIHNPQVMAELMRSVKVDQDTLFSKGVLDVLDHATATCGFGGKVAIDTTKARKQRAISIPENLTYNSQIISANRLLAEQWSILILVVPQELENSQAHHAAATFISDNNICGINFVGIIAPKQLGLTDEELLWQATANCEPSRDISIHQDYLIVDARCKVSHSQENPSRWPNVVTSDDATISLVDKRWGEYGLGEFIPSPSLKYKPLLLSDGAER